MGEVKKVKALSLILIAVVVTAGTLFNLSAEALVPGVNVLVNYDTAGNPATAGNQLARVTEDGNTVAWTSAKHNIFPGDPFPTSTASVIYKRNLQTGDTSYATPTNTAGGLVSITDYNFAMSRSGRYVAYYSRNTNVVTSPTVPYPTSVDHVYLTDTKLGTTTLVDQSSAGVLANGNSDSTYALNVSDDGRFVLFTSTATNLLSSGNPSVAAINYYVKDMKTGEVINPTVSNSGQRANGWVSRMVSSCDGSILAFNSNSTNLTPQDRGVGDAYLVDIRNGYDITSISHIANQPVGVLSISCNGRYLILATNATNLTSDVIPAGSNSHYYRYDRLTADYVLVDKSTSGYISSTANPSSNTWGNSTIVSDDGKVIFRSNDKNMISPAATQNSEVYLRNPEMGTTELVPVNASGVEQNAVTNNQALTVNARGTVVLYNTGATNLIPGITSGATMLVLSKIQ